MMDFQLPELGEGVYEAEFVSWQVKVGDVVQSGQALMEVMTDKATMEVPAPFAGRITELNAEPGRQVKIGQVMLRYEPTSQGDQNHETPQNSTTKVESAHAMQTGNGPVREMRPSTRAALGVKAAPSVRLMARKMGIDLASITGSGAQGRILIDDLTSRLQRSDAKTASAPREREPVLDLGTPGTKLKLIGLRGRIAEHMVRSKSAIPHYSYVDECNVGELVRLRESLKDPFADKGIRLTYLPFFIKAVTRALKDVPMVNATTNDQNGEVTLHDHTNVGIAVATPHGLIVPVIADADKKSVAELAREIERLGEDARRNRVKREDLGGGTFTVTSIGSVGGLFSTPVINHPEVGILGIGKMVKRPAFDEFDNVVAAHFIYLSLSFDHRVVDGAVGASFTNALIRHLQSPALLLLDNLT